MREEDDVMPVDRLKMYVREISKYGLTPEEEYRTFKKAYIGNDIKSKKRLSKSKLTMVIRIALGFFKYNPNTMDLVQIGNVGLFEAVMEYDLKLEISFEKFLSDRIKALIVEYLKSMGVKFPN